MHDVAFLTGTIAFFVMTLGYVAVCERLMDRGR